MTIQEFATKHEITMASKRLASRPDRESSDWDKHAFHFQCTLIKGRETFEVTYSMGSGHGKKVHGIAGMADRIIPPTPSLPDVLDSVRSDAQDTDNARDFEDWASELGYGPDSIKSLRIWEACKECARKLRRFLGSAAYDELMTCDPE